MTRVAIPVTTAMLGYVAATLFPLPDLAVYRLMPDRLDFALQSAIDLAYQRSNDKFEVLFDDLTAPPRKQQEAVRYRAANDALDEHARLGSLLGIRAYVCSWRIT